MKGREWYQTTEVAAEYEDKRFSRGGRLIDRREKRAVRSALEPLDGKRVLEIACGTGRFSVTLAARGAETVGLDISAAMLSQGRRKATRAGVDDHLEFVRGDAARLPFPDDYFDAVLAMRFFHLVPEPDRFLAEIRRITDDRLVFDTFNTPSARTIYNWLLPMGSRLYAEADITAMLDRAGFDIVTAEHDFLLPYGLYRKLPSGLADAIYRADSRIGRTDAGESLASVSYWNTRVSE